MLCTLYYRFDESAILKRRERRLWEEKRTKILFEYQQFSDYGSSTALLMYELAWKMSRDTNDLVGTKELFLLILCARLNIKIAATNQIYIYCIVLFQLWWAIIGHTEQYLSLKTEVER